MKTSFSGRASQLAMVVALILLAQLPFWVIQARVSIQRPLINLDLLVAIALMLRWRGWGVAALVLAWLVEINLDASASYHFVGAADLVDAVRFMDLVRLDHLFSWQALVALAVFALCAWAMHRLVRPSLVGLVAIVAIGGAAFLLDGLNGSNATIGRSDHFEINVNIAGSPSVTTIRGAKVAWRARAVPMARFPEPRTFSRALAWQEAHPGDSMLMVLVESMGLPVSAPVRDWLIARLATSEIERRWVVDPGAEGYFGSTVYGELRVLCGLKGHYSRLKDGEGDQCLPHRFVAGGGDAVGLHGFNLRMFDRGVWWPSLGIQPQDLSQEAADPASVGCNDVFAGVCDGVVLRKAASLVQQPHRLVYAVTLDTHLPLPSKDMPLQAGLAGLCAHEGLSRDACQMVARQGYVLSQLQEDLAALARPVMVLVSGDHAPPFLGADSKSAFDPARVLTFALQPRPSGVQ